VHTGVGRMASLDVSPNPECSIPSALLLTQILNLNLMMLDSFIPKPDLDECPTCGAKNVFSIEDDRCEVCIVPPSMRKNDNTTE
jgi:hypothetical protein